MTPTKIQVSLNGSAIGGGHQNRESSLDEIIDDSLACARIGASDFHVHPRNSEGSEAIDAETIEKWVTAFNQRLPLATISLSTAAWIAPLAQRLREICSWSVRPHYASVNFHEEGAEEIADALLNQCVGVEAGISDREGARRFLNYERRQECRRLMFEMPNKEPQAVSSVFKEIYRILANITDDHELILHGEGRSAWPILQLAVRNGLRGRIGLEDTILLPDLRVAENNVSILTAAVEILKIMNNEDAEMRRILRNIAI